MRGDNLPIVDLTKYNTNGKEPKYLTKYDTNGKEAKYVQINYIVGKLTANKKATEEHIKIEEFEFLMDLKTPISKTAIDPELTRVRNSMLPHSRRQAVN